MSLFYQRNALRAGEGSGKYGEEDRRGLSFGNEKSGRGGKEANKYRNKEAI